MPSPGLQHSPNNRLEAPTAREQSQRLVSGCGRRLRLRLALALDRARVGKSLGTQLFDHTVDLVCRKRPGHDHKEIAVGCGIVPGNHTRPQTHVGNFARGILRPHRARKTAHPNHKRAVLRCPGKGAGRG